jgi:leucyl-tRNA synthetase
MVRSQWMLKITAYAQRLIDDLDTWTTSKRSNAQQINWIAAAKARWSISRSTEQATR